VFKVPDTECPVLLYFSAQWCPPCRQFTPLLKQFYESLPAGALQIVFVSRDKSVGEFWSYYQKDHGSYLAASFAGNARDEMAKL
jgi:nucleoredoxin